MRLVICLAVMFRSIITINYCGTALNNSPHNFKDGNKTSKSGLKSNVALRGAFYQHNLLIYSKLTALVSRE